MIWLALCLVFAVGTASAVVALRRRRPACVFASALLLNVMGSMFCAEWGERAPEPLIHTNVLCLAVNSILWILLDGLSPTGVPHLTFRGRPLVCAHVAAELAFLVLLSVAVVAVGRTVTNGPHPKPQLVHWMALATTFVAVVLSQWDRQARFAAAGLYALALAALSMGQIQRGYWPGAYFVWGAVCEWAGLLIVAALVGWSFRRFRFFVTLLRIPAGHAYWPEVWFTWSQALFAVLTGVLVVWISTDSSFDGMGGDHALLGLSGRMASCPAALMLLGATILMAWQMDGAWRAAWQYAAMASGVLFTISVGWARIELDGGTAETVWYDRSVNLLMSVAMMTLLTSFGLARVLPRSGDWIIRARSASPVFGFLAVLSLIAVLAQRALLP